jgi:hypothetical protein
MLMMRINVPLEESEAKALICMAETDCRQPREQLRYLLREAAQSRGLLPQLIQHTNDAPQTPPHESATCE